MLQTLKHSTASKPLTALLLRPSMNFIQSKLHLIIVVWSCLCHNCFGRYLLHLHIIQDTSSVCLNLSELQVSSQIPIVMLAHSELS